MSWIHIDDIAGIFRLSIDNDGASGPLNGTAPTRCETPIRQDVFQRAQKAVHAVAVLSAGRSAGRIAPARAGRSRRPSSRPASKVLPAKPLALGYHFKYPHLADALRAIFTPVPPHPTRRAPAAAPGAGAHH